MQTPIDFGKEYLDTFYHKQDAEAALSFLADDLVYVSADEVYHFRSSKEIRSFLRTAVFHDPASYVDIISIKSPPGAGDTVTVVYEVNIIPRGAATGSYRRILLVIRRDISQAIICVNISAPYSATLASALEKLPAPKAAAGAPEPEGERQEPQEEELPGNVTIHLDEMVKKGHSTEELNELKQELEGTLARQLKEKQEEIEKLKAGYENEIESLKEQHREKEEDIKRQAQTELDLYQAQLRGESASRQARTEWELSSKYMKKEKELSESFSEKEKELSESYSVKEKELSESYSEKEKEFIEKADGYEQAIREKDDEIRNLDQSLKDTERVLEETRQRTEDEKRELEEALNEMKKEASAAGDKMEILQNERKRQESLFARTSALRDSADAEVRKAIRRIDRLFRYQEVPLVSKRFKNAFEQLLDMACSIVDRTPLREKSFSLDEMMNTFCAVIGTDCRNNGFALDQELPDKEVRLCGDPARILQILFNIFEEVVLSEKDGTAGTGAASSSDADRELHICVTSDRPVRGRTYLNFTLQDTTGLLKTALQSPEMEMTTQLIGMMGGSVQVRQDRDTVRALLKLNLKTE
ncbi:MAG: hypothetical protein IJ930_04560 [Lachnospiraceae bacterium]|nr:hypothetical protein [Lachnospiraceae bacterium]